MLTLLTSSGARMIFLWSLPVLLAALLFATVLLLPAVRQQSPKPRLLARERSDAPLRAKQKGHPLPDGLLSPIPHLPKPGRYGAPVPVLVPHDGFAGRL